MQTRPSTRTAPRVGASMTPRGTPLRNLRIETALWADMLEATAARGETISDVTRRSYRAYLEEPETKAALERTRSETKS